MMVEGERLKELLAGARTRVLLCAPFIKAKILETLLSVVRPEVRVRIVTRWRAEEVAAGRKRSGGVRGRSRPPRHGVVDSR